MDRTGHERCDELARLLGLFGGDGGRYRELAGLERVAVLEVRLRELERARRIGGQEEPRRVIGKSLGQGRDVAVPLAARFVGEGLVLVELTGEREQLGVAIL